MKNKIKMKDILILQTVFIIYSISSVVARFASGQENFSLGFIVLYGLDIAILGIYALLWQQVIKKFELSIAYANKAVTLLWALVWGVVIFGEQITFKKVFGILLVIGGILILNTKRGE